MRLVFYFILVFMASCAQQPKEAMVVGFGLALTGPLATLGQPAHKGAKLALEEVNAGGGIHGRPLEIDFQDDQADPKQAVAVAQKFIANPKVLLTSEFATAPSMAVTALYQRAGLPFCGSFNFHPDFTKPGDYIWSNTPSVQKSAAHHAKYVKKLGLQKVAFLAINNDVGQFYGDFVKEYLRQEGIQIVLDQRYLPDEKDFRSVLSRAKATKVDGFVIVSFTSDGALLVRQMRVHGLRQPIIGHGALSDKFVELAGKDAEGVYVAGFFDANDSRPEVRNFVHKWKSRYPQDEVEYYGIQAYDSILLIAEVLRQSDGTRASVKDAFVKVKDFPSVLHGKINFDPVTRLTDFVLEVPLVVKEGKLVRWDEKT